jgi:hypothetical protein
LIAALLLAFVEIGWQYGPAAISLPGETLRLPRGIIYVQGQELERFLLASGNRPEGVERIVFAPEDVAWFAVASFRAEPLDAPRAFTQQQTEPDGRRTTNHHLWRPSPGGRLEFELVSNPRDFSQHRRVFDSIVRRYAPASAPSRYGPYVLAAILLLLLLVRVYYSQQHSEST